MPDAIAKKRMWGDVRYQLLAAELELDRAADAIGRVLHLIEWCLDRNTAVAPRRQVDLHLGKGGADALLSVELGREVEGGILVEDAIDQVDAWLRKQKGWEGGGQKRAEQAKAQGREAGGQFRSASDNQASSTPPRDQDRPNSTPPLDQLDTSDSPTSVQLEPALSSYSDSDPNPNQNPPLPPSKGGSPAGSAKPKRQRRGDLTDEQRAQAAEVLGWITERTQVQYRGSDAHVRLISARLHDHDIELIDLRKVIAYCWSPTGLNWKDKLTDDGTPMASFLCPETLFGPRKLSQYLDRARAWFEVHVAPRMAKEAAQERAPPRQLAAPTPALPIAFTKA
jgi:uncharacterized phage protein (TIGR02220 family)